MIQLPVEKKDKYHCLEYLTYDKEGVEKKRDCVKEVRIMTTDKIEGHFNIWDIDLLVFHNGEWHRISRYSPFLVILNELSWSGGYGHDCAYGEYEVKIINSKETSEIVTGKASYYVCAPPRNARSYYLELTLLKKPLLLAINTYKDLYVYFNI